MDGQPTPKDWVILTAETALIIAEIELLISLVELEV